MTSQLVSHMQVRPSSISSRPLKSALQSPNHASKITYKAPKNKIIEISLYQFLILRRKAFVGHWPWRPLEASVDTHFFALIFSPRAPVGRAATVGFNGEIQENVIPIFF